MRSIVIASLLAGLVATASAQTEPTAAPTAAPALAPAPAAAPLTRDQIIDALARDKALEEDFVRQLKARHALELNEATRQRHDDDSKQIALNKRHVVMAYAALWILAVVFLVVLWRRQQTLNARIAQLQKELESAVASNK
jgi:C4-dicarboxylate-specific signal transduction histidine kinase